MADLPGSEPCFWARIAPQNPAKKTPRRHYMRKPEMRKLEALIFPFAVVAIVLVAANGAHAAQWTADKPGSDNIELVSHLPLGADLSVSDIEIEQEMSWKKFRNCISNYR